MVGCPGKYLYCVIRCPEERSFDDVVPIGGTSDAVHTVSFGSLAVVASDCMEREYETTRANMLAHQRVQERVMKEFTILPVRFGTVADAGAPAEQIERLLEKRYKEFDSLLQEMEGAVELGIRALWRDVNAIFQEIVAENRDIGRLRDSLKRKPPQAAHYDRMRLGEAVKKALDRKRELEATPILGPLARIARKTVRNPTMTDRMIVSTAFLVDKRRQREFDRAVEKLDHEMGDRVTFKYVGPVPPYNFVNIVINWQEM